MNKIKVCQCCFENNADYDGTICNQCAEFMDYCDKSMDEMLGTMNNNNE